MPRYHTFYLLALAFCLSLYECPCPGEGTSSPTIAGNDHPQALDELIKHGDNLLAKRLNNGAARSYTQALKLSPESSQAHAGLGWALFDMGKRTKGINEEIKALKLDPNNALAHHFLGNMYLISGYGQQAADEYRMEYKIAPQRRCHCGPIEQLLKRYPA